MITPGKDLKNHPSNLQITPEPPADGGRIIVLTAALTEAIDHAGYFIQMALASLPIWMEGVINRKYPKWREVEHNPDGTARCSCHFVATRFASPDLTFVFLCLFAAKNV